jgi:hypothetical protein
VLGEADHTQTDVVVDVAGLVMVAVGRAAVPGVVVPGAAAQQLRDPPSHKLNEIADLRSTKAPIRAQPSKFSP